MASTADGRALTEAYRLTQARIRNRVAADLLRVWPLLDPTDVDATAGRWVRAAVPIVRDGALEVQRAAIAYFDDFRVAEIGQALRDVPGLVSVPAGQIETSLTVTGPYDLKRQAVRGVRFDDAVERARAASSQAGARHALGAGRRWLVQAVRVDTRAQFWSRVTSAKPCGFCAMLASRGAVYSADSADFEAHDRCGCTVEPGYRRGALSDSAQQFQSLWQQTTRDVAAEGGSTADVARAFRRAVEA